MSSDTCSLTALKTSTVRFFINPSASDLLNANIEDGKKLIVATKATNAYRRVIFLFIFIRVA